MMLVPRASTLLNAPEHLGQYLGNSGYNSSVTGNVLGESSLGGSGEVGGDSGGSARPFDASVRCV
jgi:hypothetical protein